MCTSLSEKFSTRCARVETSDEEDDTAAQDEAAAAAVGAAKAPEGFRVVLTAPPMGSRQEEQALIGQVVLFAASDGKVMQ